MVDIVAHQTRDVGVLEGQVRKLRRQLELLSREREERLDNMEQTQLALENAQLDVARLREALRVKIAEGEELKRSARKEALQLVKKQWRKKLEELVRGNTGLLHELQLRDAHIAKLQKIAVSIAHGSSDVGCGKLLDNVAELTTELLHREQLMMEKDAVLHEYEARVERAEQATHSALESKCKLEFRISSLMLERDEILGTLAEVKRRNQELERCEPPPPLAAEGDEGDAMEDSHETLSACGGKQTEVSCQNGGDLQHRQLCLLLLARLASSEDQLRLGNQFLTWMAFVLRKKIHQLQVQEQRITSAVATATMLGETLERVESCIYWTKEVAAETYAQLEEARKALDDQQRTHKCGQDACEEMKGEMMARIAALEAQVREAREQEESRQESLPRIVAVSEKSSCTELQFGADHVPTTAASIEESEFSSSRGVLYESLGAAAAAAAATTTTASDAESETMRDAEMTGEELVSDAIDSLSVVQDGSEAGAIISTLLSLHRQGVERWRVRATEAQHHAKKAEREAFILSALLHRSVLPYLLALHEAYTDTLTSKTDRLLVESLCALAAAR